MTNILSQESTITVLQMVEGLWISKARCTNTISNTSWCHGAMRADRNFTGSEKASLGLSLCCDLFCPNFDAQIAQKSAQDCAQIVLEKKTSHIFYSQDRNIYWKITVFLKKKWKNSEKKKKISVENTVFFRIKFSLPKNLFSSQLSTMDNSTCPISPH